MNKLQLIIISMIFSLFLSSFAYAINIANSLPTHSTPVLNSASGKNYSTDDLTCYNQSTYDGDGDSVTNIYNWYKDDDNLMVLNMPFEINAHDYSDYGNDGTIYGNPQYVTGKYGKGLEFDGDDYIFIPDSNSLDFTNKKTWQLWFKRDGTGTETLFDKGDGTNSNYKLEFLNDNRLKFSYSLTPGPASYLWKVDDKPDFDEGTYTQTNYNTTYNAVMLDSSYSGDYKSKIFSDSEKILSFNTLSWSADVPTIPTLEELSPEEGMVGLWHLNEESGTIIDSSGEGNNGTYNGALYNQSGKLNTAIGFDGSNDYIDCGSDTSLAPTSEISIEAWVYPTDAAYNRRIVCKPHSTTWSPPYADYELVLQSTRKALFMLTLDGTHYYIITDETIPLNTWTHLAATYDGSYMKIYINGAEKKSTGKTGSIETSGQPLYIGTRTPLTSEVWKGRLDEVSIFNKSLSSSEIQEDYQKGVGILTNLSLSVRSCDDANCDGESFVDIGTSPVDISFLSDNKYFQFKAELSTNDTDYSPKLYNVTLNYSAEVVEDEANITSSSSVTDTNWHLATITFDDVISENNFKLYLNDSLETQKTEHDLPANTTNDLYIGSNSSLANYFDGKLDEFRIYEYALSLEQIQKHNNTDYNKIVSEETEGGDVFKCSVTPNDGIGDGATLDSENLTVLWNVTFNVTESYDGTDISNVEISCDYPGFNQNGDTSNPYGPYGFPPGSYNCNFSKALRFDEEITFTANDDKVVNVQMSESGYLSEEEHEMLEWLYNCWHHGDCWDLLLNINQTTTNIWKRVVRTNRDVIAFENITSYTLSSTSNITIDYTIDIPYKEGYASGELLPLRMFFWITDVDKTKCFNQDKRTDSNIAESPFCMPLIAETLGPNGGSVSFTVELRPNLPDGDYNITRSIEIDPIITGERTWTNYGQESIGTIFASGASGTPSINLIKKSEIYPGAITGLMIWELLTQTNISLMISFITLGLVCYLIIKINKKKLI